MQYEYIYCVVHKTYIPYPGTFYFSRYPSVALARNKNGKWRQYEHQEINQNGKTKPDLDYAGVTPLSSRDRA